MQFLPFINLGEFFPLSLWFSRVVNRFSPILLYYQLTPAAAVAYTFCSRQKGNQVNWYPLGGLAGVLQTVWPGVAKNQKSLGLS